jgi:hypothetical protein
MKRNIVWTIMWAIVSAGHWHDAREWHTRSDSRWWARQITKAWKDLDVQRAHLVDTRVRARGIRRPAPKAPRISTARLTSLSESGGRAM